MPTLKASTTVSVTGTFSEPGDLANTNQSLNLRQGKVFTSGTGVNQVDVQFQDQRTLAATSERLNLAASGVDVHLPSPFGGNLSFAKVKALYVHNTSTTDNLTIGGAAANAWATPFADATDKVLVPPEGVLLLTAPRDGYAVTFGTGDKLQVDAGAATTTYEIIIQGTSA